MRLSICCGQGFPPIDMRTSFGLCIVLTIFLFGPMVRVGAQSLEPAPIPLKDLGVFAGGVPTGQRTDTPLSLTLRGAIDRGLEHNLGVIAREQELGSAQSGRWAALESLLPNVSTIG
jgi:hypothetical protein